ncbi:GNAT family N-acetyltransferase [Saxibacter everestensis]|uniref:GNAT family N-acetyltransferase n=1 Tax=Saxibacter everestensis TaxID=2909229 RepID=A0ABY8QY40_9MICO|nr:GNAT family N-acetyltransferase [Brevibacteriaceae bacterium ZFBP1038]
MSDWQISAPRSDEYQAWKRLFDGYLTFYRKTPSEERAQTVWGWLQDPAHEVSGLLARSADGTPVALAHYRPFARPIAGEYGGWVDDLFADPAVRGEGVMDALASELQKIAAASNWGILRWITADDNYRARSKYDRIAARTMWITYDAQVKTD